MAFQSPTIRPRILVADDDLNAAYTDALILREAGYTVATATTARDCVSVIHNERIDLILLDMRFGVVDGLTVLRRLRRWGVRTPIVVVTGFGDIDSAVLAMKCGATHFVSKPLFEEQLLRIVAENLVSPLPQSVSRLTLSGPCHGRVPYLNRPEVDSNALLERLSSSFANTQLSVSQFMRCARAFRNLTESARNPLLRSRLMEAQAVLNDASLEFRTPEDERIRSLTERLISGAPADLSRSEADWGLTLALHRTWLGRRLRTESGSDFRAWRRACRMKRAAFLLVTTDEQAAQIGFAVGFRYSQLAQFTRECRATFGLSPLEFRRAARQCDPWGCEST